MAELRDGRREDEECNPVGHSEEHPPEFPWPPPNLGEERHEARPYRPAQPVLDYGRDREGDEEVDEAFKTGWIRRCNDWESWNGRRCKGYCEVAAACTEMDASQRKKAA